MVVERVVGIDFGTSSSVIKIKTYVDGKPMGETVGADYVRFHNRDWSPTLVYTAKNGSLLFGYEAANASVPGSLSCNFKLDLISEDAEVRENALRLTKLFFEYLFKTYMEQSPRLPACDIEKTIVSYPAKWPQHLRDEMLEVAQSVGFKDVTGLDEPTAAVGAVIVHDSKSILLGSSNEVCILVVDMGAGTTDLVLCKYSPASGVSILNVWPKGDGGALLGGREVDEALCEYVKKYLEDCGLPGSRDFRDKYIDKCKAWKETNVSSVLAKPDGIVRYCGFAESIVAMLGTDAQFPPLSRADFEGLLESYLAQFPQMINDCLEDAGIGGADVDCVILTGGHSQWYFAGEILTGKITKYGRTWLTKIIADENRVIRTPNPQETVALGLAYYGLSDKPPPIDEGEVDGDFVFCAACGTKNNKAAKFCKQCGASMLEQENWPPQSDYVAPQTAVNRGKAAIFDLPQGKTLQGAANAIQSLLESRKMNVQVVEAEEGGVVVQARDKAGKWKQFIGMDAALGVVLRQESDNAISLEFKQAKWIDKGGVMALSLVILWPLAITSGIGMYIQGRLPGDVQVSVATYINS